MKKLLLFAGLLAVTTLCMSQNNNNKEKMEKEHIVYFSFDQNNAMAMNGEKYNVSILKDGRIKIVIDEGLRGEKELYTDDSTIFDELLNLVKTYEMDKYESNYQPDMRVFDGDSWSLYYKYDTRRSVSSGGYMAWPDNFREAHEAMSHYFQKWRDCQKGVVEIDYFKFTTKNNQGRDIAYTLERGETEATITIHDAEQGIDKSLKVSNDVITEFHQRASLVRLKSSLYDHIPSDPDATMSTYFVRYNNGDTIEGKTGYTTYPSHKESAIMDFFERWLRE